MSGITNKKIKGFIPIWAQFNGFSFLFDNPGASLKRSSENLQVINCISHSTQLTFYKLLEESLEKVGNDRLSRDFLFFQLPFQSFHVTALDGINEENINPKAEELHSYIKGLPHSFQNMPNVFPNAIPKVLKDNEVIAFEFDELKIFSNNVLVAKLKPKKTHSATFQRFLENRKLIADDLNGFQKQKKIILKDSHFKRLEKNELEEQEKEILSSALKHMKSEKEVYDSIKDFKITLRNKTQNPFVISKIEDVVLYRFTPHISLGYFGNEEIAEKAIPLAIDWNKIFQKKLKGKSIVFNSISLYGFTNMETFFKI